MKKKNLKIKSGIIKYLLVLPLFLLSFCQSEFEGPTVGSENKLTVDAKVLALMKSAIQSDSDQNLTQNKGTLSKSAIAEDDGQCTYFLYPMTFEVFSGDDPNPVMKEINSDEELIAFIETFTFENEAVASTPNYEMYIYFPITLLDTDGYETVLNNLTELEGTLQMAVEACESFNNVSDAPSTGGSTDGSTGGSTDGSTGGSTDGSTGGSTDGSTDGSTGGSTDGSSGGSTDGSTDGSTGGSTDGSTGGSTEGSTDGSTGGSTDGSTGGSTGGSTDGSTGGSTDGSAGGSTGGSTDGSTGGSTEVSNDSSTDDNSFTSNESENEFEICDKNGKKVSICHKGKTICISVNAIWQHLEQHEEDYKGTCED